MKKDTAGQGLLLASICGYALLSASFLLMPMSQPLPGILFWAGLALGIIPQILLEHQRRQFFRRYRANRKRYQKRHCGALTFFSGPAAQIADIFFLISLTATLLALIITRAVGYICYVTIALTVFTFSLHCVTNGRNYFHVYNQRRVRQVLEKGL